MRSPAKLVIAAAVSLSALLPAAPASADSSVYLRTCPSGYEGVIVGTPWGEFYVCQNIIQK